jgi:hypothetical protein
MSEEIGIGKFVKNNPKIIKVLILIVLICVAFSMYRSAVELEKKELALAISLGFESAGEMKSMKRKGFKTKADFNNAEAKKIGFENHTEMIKRLAQGIKNGKELEDAMAKAKSLGFYSVEEMIELQAKGFENMAEKLAKDKADELEKIALEKARLVDADYLFKEYGSDARVGCEPEIERLAKFNFEWFDKWYETRFPRYLVLRPGVLVVAGHQIRFQNGFGGWQIMSYMCEYDTKNKRVLSVIANPK